MDLAELVADPLLELTFRRIVDEWADRRLGEMLDYVYFHTEPMMDAQRGAPLDFQTIDRQRQTVPGRLPNERPDRHAVARIRQVIAARRARRVPRPP